PKIGYADNGVRRRAAGHLGRRAHVPVDRGRAGFVDQGHAAFGHAMAGKEALVGLHQDIENRVADAENVVFRCCHPSVLLRHLRWRGKSAPNPCKKVLRPITTNPAPASDGWYGDLMIRSFLTVSSGTLISRLLGFVRDSMIAALLGAGPVADAFLLAFQLVNVIRRLLTEGALNAALVPAWLRVHDGEGATMAAAFAGRVLGTISATLIAAAALIAMLMPLLMTALAPGFAGHPTMQLAVDDARLMLPYL